MMITFHDAREAVMRYLLQLNTSGISEVTEGRKKASEQQQIINFLPLLHLIKGLRTIITIRNITQDLIDSATGSEECVNVAVATWERALETGGVSVATCSDQSFSPVGNATDDFLNYVAERAAVAFAAQNLVLNALSEVCKLFHFRYPIKFLSFLRLIQSPIKPN